jgi:hypothetical protein
MDGLRLIAAHVDFEYGSSLGELARVLSDRVFAGIEFTGEGTGIWDEVPAMKLARRFLGFDVELGGGEGEYTLAIDMPDFPWDLVPNADDPSVSAAVCVDISGYVVFLLGQIPEITVPT